MSLIFVVRYESAPRVSGFIQHLFQCKADICTKIGTDEVQTSYGNIPKIYRGIFVIFGFGKDLDRVVRYDISLILRKVDLGFWRGGCVPRPKNIF